MSKIDTLVGDLERLFVLPHQLDADRAKRFGEQLARSLSRRFAKEDRGAPQLRLSNLGTKCNRKLYYDINEKNAAPEELPPAAHFKFMFGDILEELLLFLAEEAGHTVQGRQKTVDLYGIPGHIDAVIDGVLVDVKSASSMSFKKFANHLDHGTDDFGYIDQLLGYLEATRDDPEVVDKSRAAFLVVDKTLGHLTLDIHRNDRTDYKGLVEHKVSIMSEPRPPERYWQDEAEGLSGNRKLGVACSYCQWKGKCWPGLRTYIYAKGPVHLTKVVREPKVGST